MNETRYAQVARDLAQGIASGRFPELGLVSRRKKAGTRVEAASTSSGYRQSLASIEDLVQFGAEHMRAVQEIEDVVADRALAKELGCRPGTRWLRISSLRLNGDANAPIGWTDVYVDAAYSELRDIARASPDVLISSLIESRYGRRIAEIRQDVSAALLPEKLAGPLRAEAGSAALRIVRHYADAAGEIFEITVTMHPADRFTFSLRLRRERE
jgi:GntR family transcriptional regulator